MSTQDRPRVIIIGAGFGGIYAARSFAKQDVDVLVIDRNNYHTFTPLLYQVATCGLEAEEIAYPVRGLFRKHKNIEFMLGTVENIDKANQTVAVRTNGHVRHEQYDYLIVAGGSQTNYFGMDGAEKYGFSLKDLQEAVKLRNHILRLYEKAAWNDNPAEREAMTTMVVIGGGPTGLETAGALYELYTHVLRREYDFLESINTRVVLIEMTDRLLRPYPEKLQEAALRQLEDIGVEVILNNAVSDVSADEVRLQDGRVIPTRTLVWAAGVKGSSPLGRMLDVELARGGRVPVKPTMEVIGHENVYVIGDMAYLEDDKGQPYPMLIPVAKQQGILAAKNILNRIHDKAEQTFRYVDRGIMATIGRSRAVAWIFYRIQLTGFAAWFAWLFLHLVMLAGFRNRFNVLINWMYNYYTYDRSARVILGVRDTTYEDTNEATEPAAGERVA